MFHKRLLKEFACNQKYIVGMVVMKWITLLTSIIMTGASVIYLNKIYKHSVEVKDTVLYLFLAVTILGIRAVAVTMENKMSFSASVNVKNTLRKKIYIKLMELGTGYKNIITASEAAQISTEGVDQLDIYFGKYLPQFFYSLLAPLTLFVVVGSMSIKAAVVLLVCVPLIPISIICVQKLAKKMLSKYWGTYTELGASFLEGLHGLTTLKIYQADKSYEKKMDEEAEKFRKITMKVLIMQLNSISVMDFVAYGGAAAGIILSILEYQGGNLNITECLFIILVSVEFFLPLRRLGSFFHIAMNGNAAADKIFCLLDTELEDNGAGKYKVNEKFPIVFSNVIFGYNEEKNVLQNIDFKIKRNTFNAISGVSGCGKSTIASIIMGEQRCYKGSVIIGGAEGKEMSGRKLYENITKISHDSYLFQGTVEENLKMGNPYSGKEEMKEVLELVDLYSVIKEKGGLSMMLTERAANLSGGQKQRLALARAILHDSEIYIFDEATSNIDAESENKIVEVIEKLAKTKTVVLISHRLANIEKADNILFLQNGKIEEKGTHKELIEKKGYYYDLYENQKRLEKYAREA